MITFAELKEFLASIGITAPDFMLEAIICVVDNIEACLDGAGKDECEKKLISTYVAALMALSQGASKISADKLPSGAARNYENTSIADTQKMLYNSLSALDTANCTSAILPAPLNGSFLAVVGGGC